jgi:hypothetical protein
MAAVDGMNVFVAAVILCQMPLQDFLDLPADARLCRFGTLVGGARIVSVFTLRVCVCVCAVILMWGVAGYAQ